MKYQMACESFYWNICFIKPPSGIDVSIFGFAEFISALALLVIVYTITGIRYKFRIEAAPIPIFKITFFFIVFIGFGTMMTDIWYAERWIVPSFLLGQPIWQGLFGIIFFMLALSWIYFAFIKPPIFNKRNAKKYGSTLYRAILQGSENDLPIIANELERSAESLVKLSSQRQSNRKNASDASNYAYDMILLIGNRKLCKHIISSSPVTAIAFFEEIANTKKYGIPIGQFAKNISAEAILNKESILYHEDEGYKSGLIGYLKPFSQSIYGNYRLVEALADSFCSPFDIDYEIICSWNATQLEAYSRSVMITLKNYIKGGNMRQHSYALHRALVKIQDSCSDVYELNDVTADYYSTDIYKRFGTIVDFFKEVIILLTKQEHLPETELRVRDDTREKDFYDHLSDRIFEIIFYAAQVKSPPDKCWSIHHNIVWFNLFSTIYKGKAWEIIHFKVRRLLYDKIIELEKYPNYKSSIILGFCLNVMGLKIRKKKGIDKNTYALQKAVLSWTRNNYMQLREKQPEVAESCLIGSISFEESTTRLVKTYNKGLNLEAPKEYLELNDE